MAPISSAVRMMVSPSSAAWEVLGKSDIIKKKIRRGMKRVSRRRDLRQEVEGSRVRGFEGSRVRGEEQELENFVFNMLIRMFSIIRVLCVSDHVVWYDR
jgi:hypothetical protein